MDSIEVYRALATNNLDNIKIKKQYYHLALELCKKLISDKPKSLSGYELEIEILNALEYTDEKADKLSTYENKFGDKYEGLLFLAKSQLDDFEILDKKGISYLKKALKIKQEPEILAELIYSESGLNKNEYKTILNKLWKEKQKPFPKMRTE